MLYESIYMRWRLGYWPNLRNPRTFNEHLGALKLRNVQFKPRLADKFEVREYVAERVGEQYLVPLVCLISSEADLASLPSTGRFIAKATHASGWNQRFDAANAEDLAELRLAVRAWLSRDYGVSHTNERWYSKLSRRVVVEELLIDEDFGVPLDFKLFVFRGRVRFIQVDADRFGAHKRRFYSADWVPQDWGLIYELADPMPRPHTLQEMIWVAENLGAEEEFLRIDLYSLNGRRVLFGEITFAPESGRGRFMPSRAIDLSLGRLFDGESELPQVRG